MTEILFLGTSCMRPTKERNHPAILIYHDKESILMDCGENTQRQMRIANVDINRISRILISHWHGDHVLGIPGLVQTLASQEYAKTLEIYGPRGTKKRMEHLMQAFAFEGKIDMQIIEVEKDGLFYENMNYELHAYNLNHGVPCIGFAFVEKDRRRIKLPFVRKLGMPDGPLLGKLQAGEDVKWKGKDVSVDDATYIVKGKKIAYISDTELCDNCVELARDADVLISESTHASKIEDKAEETKHMTAKSAGLVASQANVKKLVLTHFSTRYKDTKELEEEARDRFDNVVASYDFLKIKV